MQRRDTPRSDDKINTRQRPMDTLFLKELRVETVIGVFGWERCVRQIMLIDLEMAVDAEAAAANDNLADTFDYKAIAKRIKAFAEAESFQLVETFAEGIAAILLNEFSVPEVKVTVSKPGAVRGSKTVGISIKRHK